MILILLCNIQSQYFLNWLIKKYKINSKSPRTKSECSLLPCRDSILQYSSIYPLSTRSTHLFWSTKNQIDFIQFFSSFFSPSSSQSKSIYLHVRTACTPNPVCYQNISHKQYSFSLAYSVNSQQQVRFPRTHCSPLAFAYS